MKTRGFYRKIFILAAISLCWPLIAPKPASAGQKGLNVPPPTTTRAAPKVEPPPPAPPQGALKVGKIPAPVQGPQPEPPTIPQAALGGVKMQKPSAEYGGARNVGLPKSFFDMPKVEGGQASAKPGAPIPPGITPKGAAVGIIDDNMPRGDKLGNPIPPGIVPKVEAAAIVDDNKPGGAAGIVAPSDLKPPPGGAAPGGS